MDYYSTSLSTPLALQAHNEKLLEMDARLHHIDRFKPYIGFLSVFRKGLYVSGLAGAVSGFINNLMGTPLHPIMPLIAIALMLMAYTLGAVAIKLTRYQLQATNDLRKEMLDYMHWFRKTYGWIDLMNEKP